MLLQAALIVLPVAALATIALHSLRQDRVAILGDATARATAVAGDLVTRLGPRVTQILAGETPLEGIVAGGRIQSPPDSVPPTPPGWLDRLSPAESRLWRQAEAATFQHKDPQAARRALAALSRSTSPDVRANAEFALLALDAPANGGRFVDLARRYPRALTESGAPLGAVALLAALRTAKPGPLSEAFLAELARQVHETPSFLTVEILEEASKFPNAGLDRGLDRIREEWAAWQITLDALHEILRSAPEAGSPFQRSLQSGKYFALGTPAAGGWKVHLYTSQAVRNAFARALAGVSVPVIGPAALSVQLADDRWRVGGSLLPDRLTTVTLAATPGTFALDGPRSVYLYIEAGEAALYAGYDSRFRLMSAFVLCAALAALTGLYSLWRGFQRHARLGELKLNFVSSVSHELRAPLGAVRLMAENLEGGKVPDPARQNEYFRLISQECRRLSALVENVLDFSGMESGRKQYRFQPGAVLPLLQHTVAVMEPFAAEHGVRLALAMPQNGAASLEPCWDAASIEQSLVNLLDNAIKHSPAGAAVTMEVETIAGGFRLWVEDSGAGIPPEEQSRIFDLFYRSGSELRRETRGAGIGLSIVKQVAEAHGGRVLVESQPGRGSRFGLELPLRSAHV